MKLDEKVKNFLIEKGYDPKNGARPLRRAIEDNLESIISEKIRRLFIASGINVNILVKTDMIPTQTDRPLSLETLNRLIPEQSESTLVSKYSLNL